MTTEVAPGHASAWLYSRRFYWTRPKQQRRQPDSQSSGTLWYPFQSYRVFSVKFVKYIFLVMQNIFAEFERWIFLALWPCLSYSKHTSIMPISSYQELHLQSVNLRFIPLLAFPTCTMFAAVTYLLGAFEDSLFVFALAALEPMNPGEFHCQGF
jgi:hypothetical protein